MLCTGRPWPGGVEEQCSEGSPQSESGSLHTDRPSAAVVGKGASTAELISGQCQADTGTRQSSQGVKHPPVKSRSTFHPPAEGPGGFCNTVPDRQVSHCVVWIHEIDFDADLDRDPDSEPCGRVPRRTRTEPERVVNCSLSSYTSQDLYEVFLHAFAVKGTTDLTRVMFTSGQVKKHCCAALFVLCTVCGSN